MNTVLSHRAPTTRADRSINSLTPLLIIVTAAIAVGVGTTSSTSARAAVAVPAAALLLAVCLTSPRRAVILLLMWLAVFGTVRRLLLPSGGSGGDDPLLLVAPVVLGLLVLISVHRGALSGQTRFTKSVLLLSGLVVAAALNPLQGGLAVGAGGLLFVLVPLLWFWVGRSLVDDALLIRILRLIGVLSALAAVYGLWQVYIGMPSWDQRWIDTKGYAALYVGRSVRPFASFASSSEYVGLLSIGMLLWALHLSTARRAVPAAAVLVVLGWAITVASVRHALVVVPVALGVTFAARHGYGIARTALVGATALVLLALAVSQFDATRVGGAQTSALLSRQVTGLSDPFNRETSTLPGHIGSLVGGVQAGFRNPLGLGIGVVTIANDRFGSSAIVQTDSDPSNVALAMGIPGLLAYGAVVVGGLKLAFRYARSSRDFLTLAALGISLVTVLSWLAGGNYAVAPLPWLVLGWLDRRAAIDDSLPPA